MLNRLHWLTRIVVIGWAVAGCSAEPPVATPSPAGDWGPLAVWDDPGTGDSERALLSGVVSIGEECVTVGGTVVVWPETFTRWVPEAEMIEFLDPRTGALFQIQDGVVVELGGGEVIAELPWIVPPDASCPASLFGVGTLGSVNGESP